MRYFFLYIISLCNNSDIKPTNEFIKINNNINFILIIFKTVTKQSL